MRQDIRDEDMSYCACAARAYCFAPVTEDAVTADPDAREDVEVREVVVPCERREGV